VKPGQVVRLALGRFGGDFDWGLRLRSNGFRSLEGGERGFYHPTTLSSLVDKAATNNKQVRCDK
jgi:hypothetical protein